VLECVGCLIVPSMNEFVDWEFAEEGDSFGGNDTNELLNKELDDASVGVVERASVEQDVVSAEESDVSLQFVDRCTPYPSPPMVFELRLRPDTTLAELRKSLFFRQVFCFSFFLFFVSLYFPRSVM
jgi:hypothetical protein